MSLNLENAVGSGGPRKARPLAKAGAQPARICHIIDIGVQERSFKGQTKAPVRQIFINFELVNEEHKDEDSGNVFRLNLSPKRFNFLNNEKSTLVKFLAAIDPTGECGGDLTKLINKPCLVTVIHNKKTGEKPEDTRVYANFGGVIPPPEGYPVKELLTDPIVFEFDNPDKELLRKIPKFVKDDMKKAINYSGSKVEQLIRELETEDQTAESQGDNKKDENTPY